MRIASLVWRWLDSFAENLASLAPGLADTVTHGAGFIERAELALAG